MFLPAGETYSVDSLIQKRHRFLWTAGSLQITDPPPPSLKNTLGGHHNVFNGATVAFYIQMYLVYLFAVVTKHSDEWNVNHTAVQLALQHEGLSTPIGQWLSRQKTVCKALTAATMLLETWGPFLFLIPFSRERRDRMRSLGLFIFTGFHLSLGIKSPYRSKTNHLYHIAHILP